MKSVANVQRYFYLQLIFTIFIIRFVFLLQNKTCKYAFLTINLR